MSTEITTPSNRVAVVAHLLSASVGEQRFERIVGVSADAKAEAVGAAMNCAKELLLQGEPVTMWVTTDLHSA